MSKLSVPGTNNFGSKSSQRTVKTKDSLVSKKSRYSGSLVSEHGSRFGRSVNRFPKANDPGLVQTLSVENSRIVRTVFNPTLAADSKLPDLTETAATDSIRELGRALNILDYEFNYASFWLLDVLSKHVKDLQMKNFSSSHQETFLSWFRFVLRCISITGSSREEIFTLLQEMFKSAVEMIDEGASIPHPEDIDIGGSGDIITAKLSADLSLVESLKSSKESVTSRKGRKRTLSHRSSRKTSNNSGKSKKSESMKSSIAMFDEHDGSQEDIKKLNMQAFLTFINMLYQIFAERFAFTMTNLAYSSPNTITLVDLRVKFNDPKPLKTEPEPTPSKRGSPDSRKSGTKGRKKSKEKGKKKKKKSTSVEDDKSTKVKSDSGKKKGKKSRDGSKPSADMDVEIGDKKKNKKDKKGKSEKESSKAPSKKGKGGKEKPAKNKSAAGLDDERLEEPKDDQSKTDKTTKEGKTKKSKEGSKKKSKTSDASAGKENKITKSKGGKDKGKPKKGVKDLEDGGEKGKQTKGKGKSGAKSAKSGKKKKSTMSSVGEQNKPLDERQLALQKLMKQFDRPDQARLEDETEKENKFIFPLSDAIAKDYVENLICSLLPPEVQKEAEPKLAGEKTSKDTRKSKSSRRSSGKSKKKKPKSKKK